MAYYDATNGDLRYARCGSGCVTNALNWTLRTVDSVNAVGTYASLAREPLGGVAFAAYNSTTGDLRWARLDTAAACAP